METSENETSVKALALNVTVGARPAGVSPSIGNDDGMAKPVGADKKRVAVDLGTAVGAELTRLRTQRGWSQSKFGKMVGYDEGYIRQLERGTKSSTLRTLSNIAAAFGVPVSALIRGAERKISRP